MYRDIWAGAQGSSEEGSIGHGPAVHVLTRFGIFQNERHQPVPQPLKRKKR
jgi:hypothetical protein